MSARKLTPQDRLIQAKRWRTEHMNACPCWDYESYGECDVCAAHNDAVDAARRAWQASLEGAVRS